MKDRIYICHTYYHVYVSFLKELNLPKEKRGQATLLLSSLSTQFENLKERVESTGLFDEVLPFEEKAESEYPELAKYRRPQNSLIKHLIQRIIFTKKFAKFVAKTLPVDFHDYKDIYVFCDSDPIGYYLNGYRIHYHAVEDGLNCIKNYDAARYDNRGHFQIKAFLSERLNLIFIQNGYGKYCLDMEVNDIDALKYSYRKYIEVPRQALVDKLSQEDKNLILKAFIRNREELEKQINSSDGIMDKILILTEPLCTLEIRKKIFRDLVKEYQKEGTVFLKPHPRDGLDYKALFSDVPQFDGTVPMEMLNYFPKLHFKKVISVLTETKAIQFADEVIRLGSDFMDRYEDPLIHRQNEQI